MRGKWKRIKRTPLALFLALTITFGVVGDTTKVFAQEAEPTFDQQFFSGNDVFFYDPTYQAVCSGAGLVGGSTKEKIWNFLIANEFTPEQAAGLMGNMLQESGFIPVRYQGDANFDPWTEGSLKGWGLVQWDSGRRVAILNTIKEEKPHLVKYVEFEYNGIAEPNDKFPAKDFDELLLFELDYMMQESIARDLRSSGNGGFDGSADKEWARMKEQTTLRKATLFWEWNFERSGDPDIPGALDKRVADAQEIFDEFKDNLSAAGTGTTGCAAAGDLQELTLAYAWPQREDAPFPQPRPAYAEAVSAAQDEGRYVGGCASNGECKAGIDCGGFVTLLITNSGHDPNYNSGQGNTASQLAWLRDESNGWRRIGRGGDFDSAQLRPGDVAIYNSGNQGHTFVYVGKEMVEMGFGGNGSEPGIASASIGPNSWRAPMAGGETPADPQFEWFTKE